ncbi:MAG: hypothetical protein ACR2JB_20135 [Bryobacteraceae bacterium]
MQLIDERECAKVLDVSVPSLRRWRLLGTGPVFRKLNGCVRYDVTDMQKFVEDRAVVRTGAVA